jgi:TonB-like protein
LALVLLLVIPLSAKKPQGIQVEESHMFKKGEIPEELGISYHVYVKPLDLIPPDKIEPTKCTNKYSKRYAPCGIMPKPIEASYEFIAYRHVNKDKNMYGTVLVHTLINKKGEVKKCIVAKTIQDSALVDILIDEIKKSSFHPAIRNGKPVDVWVGIQVKFTHRTLQIEF